MTHWPIKRLLAEENEVTDWRKRGYLLEEMKLPAGGNEVTYWRERGYLLREMRLMRSPAEGNEFTFWWKRGYLLKKTRLPVEGNEVNEVTCWRKLGYLLKETRLTCLYRQKVRVLVLQIGTLVNPDLCDLLWPALWPCLDLLWPASTDDQCLSGHYRLYSNYRTI